MPKFKQALLYLGVAVFAVAAGFLARNALMVGKLDAETAQKGAQTIFAASLPDLQGNKQPLSQWRGKVLVVNFWATWCEPCRKEIPEFIKLQEQFRSQGLLFVGIALDQKEKVAAYSKEAGINYPVLVGDWDAIELAKAAGNRQGGLPFTVVIDRSGKINGIHLGGISQADMEAMFKPLL